MRTLTDRINEAVATARALSQEITDILDRGETPPPELYERRNRAIEDSTTLKDTMEAEESARSRIGAIQQYMSEGDESPPPPQPRAGQSPVEVLEARAEWEQALVSETARSSDERARILRTVQRVCGPLQADANGEAYARAFDAYLRSVALPGGISDEHRRALQERRVMEVVQDQTGGYTVPVDRRPGIIARTAESAKIFQRCTQIPTSSHILEWLRLKEHGTDGSIYSSGFVGSWISETPASDDGQAEPTFTMLEIRVRYARTITRLSNRLIADSALDVLSFLEGNGGQNLGLVVDKGILQGTGILNQPVGVLNDSGISTTDVSGTTADTISNTTADLGSANKLLDLAYSLPEQYLDGAVYVMRRATEKSIRKLVDAQNRFIWMPGFADLPNELLGDPIINSSFMEAEGTNGNKVILYGNLSGIICPVRNDVSAFVNPFRLGNIMQTELTLFLGVGVGIGNPDALRIGIV